jgi:predicted transcriptional regulator
VFAVTLDPVLDRTLRDLAAARRTPLSWLAGDILRDYVNNLPETKDVPTHV